MHKDSMTETPAAPQKAPSRWGQDRRLAFIDFRLRWEGKINRSDLTDCFGISIPQASLDIARYTELAPDNLQYDRSSRVYLATENFRALLAETQPEHYLNELLAGTNGGEKTEASFIGWHPSLDAAPRPGRAVDADVLASVLKAIREISALKIVYQSVSRPEPNSRTISPHALAYDGFRWHVRAFCHSRQQFRDFVLGRIIEIQGMEPAGALADQDIAWNTLLTLVLAPNPRLSSGGQRAIELDYGMIDGEVQLTCRHALLFYTLKRLGLDQPTVAQPEAQQIVLKNYADIASFLTNITETT